jgi:hypothetical protein
MGKKREIKKEKERIQLKKITYMEVLFANLA